MILQGFIRRAWSVAATGLLCLFVASCTTTKLIPEGDYLLDKISLKSDSTEISSVQLLDFVKQKPNESKLGLMIYNSVKNDSNWLRRTIRKLGEPPVIYNPSLVNQSLNELSIEMKNLGFLNANVDAVVDTVGKKVAVNYLIHEKIPYRIRNYIIQLPDSQMNDLARGIRPPRRLLTRLIRPDGQPVDSLNLSRTAQSRSQQRRRNNYVLAASAIKSGNIFDMDRLNEERSRISNILRNQGYYDLTVDNLHYLADTTLNSNQVDLMLFLKDSTMTNVYRIAKVNVFSGYDASAREQYAVVDSVERNGITIYYDKLHFLRPRVITDNVTVRPGGLFRERAGASTYGLFQALNCVSRVNVNFKEGDYPDSTLLDCDIFLTPGNIHSFQTRLGGTNNAGDLGVALDINYGHQNLFNGSEIFNIQLKGAYEFVSNGGAETNSINPNFYEIGILPSLTFPKLHFPFLSAYLQNNYNLQTQYSWGYDVQRRPEYTRNFFNFKWQIRWADRNNRITHSVSLLDVNYVAMPWKSELFQQYLNTEIDPLTRLSYDDVFTAGMGYNLIYTNANQGKTFQHLYTVRFSAESSGNALRGIFSLSHAKTNELGQYTIGGNPFAQYLKGNIDYAETVLLNETSKFAFHTAFGLAYPYQNSMILPFEKRFFAGGPNSVRGWRTRYLGPGSFNQGIPGDPTTHVGDIYYILSGEYRQKVLKWLEPAFFVDCGNTWTIRDYEGQPGGQFRWNSFYKELAIGTGVGLRFDFSFFIFRLDAGTRVYDPALPEGKRFMFLKSNLWQNSAVYVAIGYPF